MPQTQTLYRGSYGELILAVNNPVVAAGKKLLKEAIAKGYIDEPYVDMDKEHREWSALNYDLYDANRHEALVQRRLTVCNKYGNFLTKEYFVICRHGRVIQALRVTSNAKSLVVKHSSASVELGEVLEVLHRENEVITPPAKCLMVVEVIQHDRLQTRETTLPLFRTKDSSTKIDGETWFRVFCTRDGLDHFVQNDHRYLDALREGKQLAIIEVTPKGRVFCRNEPLGFLVSSVRYIRQIELIQPAATATGDIGA